MKLMTAEIEKALEKKPLYSEDGDGGKSKVIVKYIGEPGNGYTQVWLITEGKRAISGDWILEGLVTLGWEDQMHPGYLLWEWGSVMLSELEGLGYVVIDGWVKPGRQTVNDLVFDCYAYGRDRR